MDNSADNLSQADSELAAIERDLERLSALQDMDSFADHGGWSLGMSVADARAATIPQAGIESIDARISSILAKATAIDSISAGIESSGKISLRDVSALEKIYPGMIHDRVDSSQFTLNPSAQGVAAGLEAINWAKAGKFGLIGAIVIAIIAILARIFGGQQGGGGIAKQLEDKINSVNGRAERAAKLDAEIARGKAEVEEIMRKNREKYATMMKNRDELRKKKTDAAENKPADPHKPMSDHEHEAMNLKNQYAAQHERQQEAVSKFLEYLNSNHYFDKTKVPKDPLALVALRIEDMYTDQRIAECRDNFLWTATKSNMSSYVGSIVTCGNLLKQFESVTTDRQLAYGLIEHMQMAMQSTRQRVSFIKKRPEKFTSDEDYRKIFSEVLEDLWDDVWKHEPSTIKLVELVAKWTPSVTELKAASAIDIEKISPSEPKYNAAYRKLINPTVDSAGRSHILQIVGEKGFHSDQVIGYFKYYNNELTRTNSKAEMANSGWKEIFEYAHELEIEPAMKSKVIAALTEVKRRSEPMLSAVTTYMHLVQSVGVTYGTVLQRVTTAMSRLDHYYVEKDAFVKHQKHLFDTIMANKSEPLII